MLSPPTPTPPSRRALATLISDLPSGDRRKLVVRRHRPGGRHADPSHTERESRLLSLLWSAGVPVPELILADAAGAYFGTPMLVTAFAGHPLVQPRKPVYWLHQLAEALLSIHTINPKRHDLSFLHTNLETDMRH